MFSYHKFDEAKKYVVIEINENVVGGNDALAFTNILDEVLIAGYKQVIIDLSKVKIMNSSGLGMLVGGMTKLKTQSAKMIVCNIPQNVQKLLEMTNLDKVFILAADLEEANSFLM